MGDRKGAHAEEGRLDVGASVGARTSGEAAPQSFERSRAGGDETHDSGEEPTPRGKSAEPQQLRGARFDEEDPEVVPNDEGGALEASKALLDEH
jgi:hypothetical protein